MPGSDSSALTVEELLALAGRLPKDEEEPAERPEPVDLASLPSLEEAAAAAGAAAADPEPDPNLGSAPFPGPLRDASPFFDAVPRGLADGLRDATAAHRRTLGIALAVAAGTLALALAAALLAALLAPPSAGPAPEAPEAPAPFTEPAPPERLFLRYTVDGGDGSSHRVTETVTLDEDGLCAATEMEARFDAPALAAAFAAGLERDFGARCLSAEVEGGEVHAVLDVSSLGLDAASYERAVRSASRDLEADLPGSAR